MELIIFIKNNKYIVQDKNQKTIYTVKKKSLSSGKLGLYDQNNYRLYSLVQTGEDRKPTFTITHNDASFIRVSCKSLFLDLPGNLVDFASMQQQTPGTQRVLVKNIALLIRGKSGVYRRKSR